MMYPSRSKKAAVSIAGIIFYIVLTLLFIPRLLEPAVPLTMLHLKNYALITVSIIVAFGIKEVATHLATKEAYTTNLIRFHQISMFVGVPVLYGFFISYWYQTWVIDDYLTTLQAVMLALVAGGYCLLAFIAALGFQKLVNKQPKFHIGTRNL